MHQYRKRLARHLKAFIKESSFEELADQLNISERTLNRLLQAQNKVTLDQLEIICKSLNIDITDILKK